jgi:hypothetical protein
MLHRFMILRLSVEIESNLDMSRSRADSYHGGDLFDEIASLISLGLGIRCHSGGITRRWDIRQDPFGHPYEFDHQIPLLFSGNPRKPIVQSTYRTVLLSDMERLFETFGSSSPRMATALVRSSRLYQQALWVVESDPNQAWILLVSAIEVAAAFTFVEGGTPIETGRCRPVRVGRPDLTGPSAGRRGLGVLGLDGVRPFRELRRWQRWFPEETN